MWTITALKQPDVLLRQVFSEKDPKNDLLSTTTSNSEKKGKKPIRCRTCQALITNQDQAISRQGQHEHVFFNPAGLAFEVRCFQNASGCLVQGTPTAEFSWFADYHWQYALCIHCRTHLGWFFTHSESDFQKNDRFFCLIVREIL